ncbi:MAG: hypothetical protein D9V45_03005 [Chloroflexi bacterium]|nr:MAG: hypothetical protein D9V45_03005 [Chloroflexota bacterium]
MTEIKLEWPNPTGGTAIAYYDDERQEFTNILHNLNAGGAANFINFLAKMTDLPVYKITQEFQKYAVILPIAVTSPNIIDTEIPPWDAIIPPGPDKEILKMLWEGKQYKEASNTLTIGSKTLMNRVSELRKIHGAKIIPYQKDIKERFIKKR